MTAPLAEQIAAVQRFIKASVSHADYYGPDNLHPDTAAMRAAVASLSDLAAANERIRQLDEENQKFMREVAGLNERIARLEGALMEVLSLARDAGQETLDAPGAPGWTTVCAIIHAAKTALPPAPTTTPNTAGPQE